MKRALNSNVTDLSYKSICCIYFGAPYIQIHMPIQIQIRICTYKNTDIYMYKYRYMYIYKYRYLHIQIQICTRTNTDGEDRGESPLSGIMPWRAMPGLFAYPAVNTNRKSDLFHILWRHFSIVYHDVVHKPKVLSGWYLLQNGEWKQIISFLINICKYL